MSKELHIPMTLTQEQGLKRVVWQGREVSVPAIRVIQNDAVALLEVLENAIDTAEDRFKDQRGLVKRLKRELRPLRRLAEKQSEVETDEVIGYLDISREALDFLCGIFEKPPEGMQIRGNLQETAEMLADAQKDEKEKEKEKPAKPATPEE